jgi:hypothetical protein
MSCEAHDCRLSFGRFQTLLRLWLTLPDVRKTVHELKDIRGVKISERFF